MPRCPAACSIDSTARSARSPAAAESGRLALRPGAAHVACLRRRAVGTGRQLRGPRGARGRRSTGNTRSTASRQTRFSRARGTLAPNPRSSGPSMTVTGGKPSAQFRGETVEAAIGHPGRPGLIAVDDAAGRRSRVARPRVGRLRRDVGTEGRNGVHHSGSRMGRPRRRRRAPACHRRRLVRARDETGLVAGSGVRAFGRSGARVLRGRRVGRSAAHGHGGGRVAADGRRVHLDGGRPREFLSKRRAQRPGCAGAGVQQEGPRAYLWAGMAAPSAGDPGTGCSSWELLPSGDAPPDGWLAFSSNWNGGSCRALAFSGPAIFAGSHHGGVLRLAARRAAPRGRRLRSVRGCRSGNCPTCSILWTRSPRTAQRRSSLRAGRKGSSAAAPREPSYDSCSRKVFADKVTLPPPGCSAPASTRYEVVSEDDANRD